MAPKAVPYSDEEAEILLNFINANKSILLDPSNKNAALQKKNAKWAEIAANLSAKGTFRSLASAAEKWHALKKDAKREWDKAYVNKPTGGGKAREFSWKTKFIIESIGIEFHPPAKISGGYDTSNFIAKCDEQVNDANSFNNDYSPNDSALQASTETLEIPTPSESPSSTSSKFSRKRSKQEIVDENGEKTKETMYQEVLRTQLEVYQLEKYKLLLEIDLLKAKRSRMGLSEEPEVISSTIYINL